MIKKFTASDFETFKYADVLGLKAGEYRVPDFLLIGPQRTGTTWLSRHLALHPELFIPAEKELYYFNYLLEKEGDFFNSDKLKWYLNKFKPCLMDYLRLNAMNVKMMRSLPLSSVNWFQYKSATVFGEATASYAAMDPELISEVTRLNPDIKVIMLVRNPIERAWSHAKKDLVKRQGRKLSDIDFNEFIEFYKREYQVRCGLYSNNINCWRNYVPEENFCIRSFKEVAHQPAALFDDVCRFIGVEPMSSKIIKAGKVVNATEVLRIPEKHEEVLRELFADELIWLKKNYPVE